MSMMMTLAVLTGLKGLRNAHTVCKLTADKDLQSEAKHHLQSGYGRLDLLREVANQLGQLTEDQIILIDEA
jgi:hypothetical protein